MQLKTPIDLGSAIRDRRRHLNIGQNQLAARVGVSRKWIVDIEKGKPRAEIGLVLRTLNALGLRLSINGNGIAQSAAGEPEVPSVDIDRVVDTARVKRK